MPICTGVLDYFPDALAAVAECSKAGNDQHNPGEPLHWAKEKSTDEPDCILRHLTQRGTRDKDGVRHSAKVAWRALALLQREIEAERTQKNLPEPDYSGLVQARARGSNKLVVGRYVRKAPLGLFIVQGMRAGDTYVAEWLCNEPTQITLVAL